MLKVLIDCNFLFILSIDTQDLSFKFSILVNFYKLVEIALTFPKFCSALFSFANTVHVTNSIHHEMLHFCVILPLVCSQY